MPWDVARALGYGALGAAVGYFLNFPAPFLTGATVASIAAALAGQRLHIPVVLRNACFVVIGTMMGAGVTPEVYQSALKWPLSFLALAIVLVVIIYSGRVTLMRLFGKDAATATLAPTPGHLTYVLGLSADSRSDLTTVSIVQSVRLALLTLLVPVTVGVLDLQPAEGPVLERAVMSLPVLAASIAGAVALGTLLYRQRIPAAYILGGMLVSMLAHLNGWAVGDVPNWLGWPSFAIMGALIGTRFSGVPLASVIQSAGAGLTTTLLAFLAAGAGAVAVAMALDLPFPLVLIAFAPGGVETMAAMAVMLNVDTAFVAAHHIFRLLVLTFLAPAMMQFGRDRS